MPLLYVRAKNPSFGTSSPQAASGYSTDVQIPAAARARHVLELD